MGKVLVFFKDFVHRSDSTLYISRASAGEGNTMGEVLVFFKDFVHRSDSTMYIKPAPAKETQWGESSYFLQGFCI